MNRALTELGRPVTLLVAMALCGYAFILREHVFSASARPGSAEVAALMAVDTVPIFSVSLPVWLSIALFHIRARTGHSHLIRSRTAVAWALSGLWAITPTIGTLAAVHVIVCFVAGLGYPRSSDWSVTGATAAGPAWPAIAASGLSPTALALTQCAMLAVGACVSYLALAAFARLLGNPAATVLAVTIVVVALAGGALPPGLLDRVTIEHLVMLPAAKADLGNWWAGGLLMLGAAGALIGVLAARDRATWSLGIRGLRNHAALVGLLLLTALAAGSIAVDTDSPIVVANVLFQGVGGTGGFDLVWLLFGTIIFMTPAVVSSARLDDARNGYLQYVLIRTGSVFRLLLQQFLEQLRSSVLYVTALAATVLASTAAVTALGSRPLDLELHGTGGAVSYQFFVNGVLQLLFFWAVTTCAVLAIGRPGAVLAVLGVGLTVSLFFRGSSQLLIPVFANGLTRIRLGWEGLLISTTTLVAGLLVATVVSLWSVRRRGVIVY